MNTKLNISDAYRAYATLLNHGERLEDGYTLNGVTAYTGHDGYTVTLSDGVVSARLMFHSKIQFESPGSQALSRFISRINELALGARESASASAA